MQQPCVLKNPEDTAPSLSLLERWMLSVLTQWLWDIDLEVKQGLTPHTETCRHQKFQVIFSETLEIKSGGKELPQ